MMNAILFLFQLLPGQKSSKPNWELLLTHSTSLFHFSPTLWTIFFFWCRDAYLLFRFVSIDILTGACMGIFQSVVQFVWSLATICPAFSFLARFHPYYIAFTGLFWLFSFGREYLVFFSVSICLESPSVFAAWLGRRRDGFVSEMHSPAKASWLLGVDSCASPLRRCRNSFFAFVVYCLYCTSSPINSYFSKSPHKFLTM